MTINKKILETFEANNINKADGICYLLSLYYGYKPTYIPKEFKIKMNFTKIYEEKNKSFHWNVPLFEEQDTNFEWVRKEYIELFRQKNPDKGIYKNECIKRIKRLFAEYPEIRKQDIIQATKMYLQETDYRFIRQPHYFIEKGVGVSKTQDILEWVELYKEQKEKEAERIGTLKNKLQ